MPQPNPISDRLSFPRRIWYSIFPGTYTEPARGFSSRQLFNGLLLHFRARSVPRQTLKFTLTWGLGGMAVVLVAMLFVTGLMLKFTYQPVPDRAYESILRLQHDVYFGQLIRNIHHWSATALVLVVFLHLLRVYLSGAYHPPRQFNWIIGILMLLLVLGSNFTGYLLPWDQLAFWAVTICTGMLEYVPGIGSRLQHLIRGGIDIGPATLSIFFAVHTAVIPIFLTILMGFHFWRVRKARGLVIPREPDEDADDRGETVPTIPHLIVRELVVASVLIAVIMLLSILFDAPLGGEANPGLSPNPTKAPWYFAGLQELLLHFHPLFAVLVIPAVAFGFLLVLPYLPFDAGNAGVWFVSHRGRRLAVVAAVVGVILTPLAIFANEYLFDAAMHQATVPTVVTGGMLSFTLVAAFITGFYWLLQKKFGANRDEAVQSIFVMLLTAFLVLTATGIWFRGKGMALTWPW